MTAEYFPWFKHAEYTIRKTSLTQSQLTSKERDLQRQFGLTLGQLAWRRRQLRLNNGDEEKFSQEFPSSCIEAFISTDPT